MSAQEVPVSLKGILMLIKCAEQHNARDIIVAYYCKSPFHTPSHRLGRLCAFQKGFTIDATSAESKGYLTKLMNVLEDIKSTNATNEAISSETAGLAHVENYALKLFQNAYQRDMNGDFSKSTIQTFLTAGTLLEVATTLGESNEELEKARKYAKWKALYITDCQKRGEVPVPGPAGSEGVEVPDFMSGPPPPVTPQAPTPPAPQPSSSHPPSRPIAPQAPQPINKEDSDELDPDEMSMDVRLAVEKYLKYAQSALSHQDKKTVMDNLQKAMQALST